MIKAFIIEDEPMARRSMENLLAKHFPYVQIIGWADSVRSSLLWLSENGDEADVIFMDVELSDGSCFEIFRSAEIKAPVIMTTAYDNYAVNAFKVRSLDYLLKPIEVEDMKRALSRVLEEKAAPAAESPSAPKVKDKFLVKVGERIVPIPLTEILYIYAEEKSTWLVTAESHRYVLDDSLDSVLGQLAGDEFFRISRSVIIASRAVESVLKLPGGRLKISLPQGASEYTELAVSRSRADDFLAWL